MTTNSTLVNSWEDEDENDGEWPYPTQYSKYLRAKYIRKWNDLHPLTEVIDFEVDVDEAVRRDVHRMYPVGEVVIREMAQKFLKKGKLPPLPDLSRRTPAEVRQATPHDPYKTDAIVVDVDNLSGAFTPNAV